MKYLVTGGTGFIGSHIASRLIQDGHEVIVTGTRTEEVVPGAQLLECHLDGIRLEPLRNIDVVFHQAANNDTKEMDVAEMKQANVLAPYNLFKKLINLGTKKFVFASSTAVYGNGPTPYVENQTPEPLNPYADSKLLFEQVILKHLHREHPATTIVGLRYCNVYGPGECHKGSRSSMIRQIIVDVLRGRKPKLFEHGEQKRDWVYVKDVVEANLLAAKAKCSGIYNCGFGRAVSFNEIVNAVNKILGTSVDQEYIENPNPSMYQNHTECDMKEAGRHLGFVPRFCLDSALKEYVPYLRLKYLADHSA